MGEGAAALLVVAAGRLSVWVREFRKDQEAGAGIDVPCGSCTACCRSSQFIHVGPDETGALRRIPPALLFPAPALPDGHRLMGYDETGCCPMLVDGACSIYEDRPLTCRRYDCRVFAATGLSPEGAPPSPVAERAARWRFASSDDEDAQTDAALGAAVDFLRDNGALFPDGYLPRAPTQRAAFAITVVELFRRRSDADTDPGASAAETASAIMAARARLDRVGPSAGATGVPTVDC